MSPGEWRRYGKRGGCVMCALRLPEDKDIDPSFGPELRRIEVHHGIRQQELRRRGLNLWDERLAVCLCEYHHRRHTLRVRRVLRQALPVGLLEYVAEHNLWTHFDREYPFGLTT